MDGTERRESWQGQPTVRALRSRDVDAFAALYDVAAPRAYGLALKVLHDPQLAADVVQDAFLWLWQHVEQLDERRGTPTALLLTVVRRRAIDLLRARANGRERRWEEDLELPSGDPRVLELLESHEASARIRRAVDALPTEQRVVLELVYYRGYTAPEVAEALHVPVGTVRSRLRLALGKVRAALGAEVLR